MVTQYESHIFSRCNTHNNNVYLPSKSFFQRSYCSYNCSDCPTHRGQRWTKRCIDFSLWSGKMTSCCSLNVCCDTFGLVSRQHTIFVKFGRQGASVQIVSLSYLMLPLIFYASYHFFALAPMQIHQERHTSVAPT